MVLDGSPEAKITLESGHAWTLPRIPNMSAALLRNSLYRSSSNSGMFASGFDPVDEDLVYESLICGHGLPRTTHSSNGYVCSSNERCNVGNVSIFLCNPVVPGEKDYPVDQACCSTELITGKGFASQFSMFLNILLGSCTSFTQSSWWDSTLENLEHSNVRVQRNCS